MIGLGLYAAVIAVMAVLVRVLPAGQYFFFANADLQRNSIDNPIKIRDASIGGPVLIPGLDFNRNRDKLFFFAMYEARDYKPTNTSRT